MANTAKFSIESAISINNQETDYAGYKLEVSSNDEVLEHPLNLSHKEIVAKLQARGITYVDSLEPEEMIHLLEESTILGDVRVKVVGDKFVANEFSQVLDEKSTEHKPVYRKVKKDEVGKEFTVTQDGLYVEHSTLKIRVPLQTSDYLKNRIVARGGSIESVAPKAATKKVFKNTEEPAKA